MALIKTGIFVALFLLASAVSYASEPGKGLEGCFTRISLGEQEEVLVRAKAVLREDRWQPYAQACFAMAYYSLGKTERAVVKLREVEETLPKTIIDAVYDIVWNFMPELLAEKEYRDNFTVTGGDCILRNVKAIEGKGYLFIGNYFNPYNSTVGRHLRGRKCDAVTLDCRVVDLVCPDCVEREEEAVIEVKDYRVAAVRIKAEGLEFSRNLRYIEKVLELLRR